MPKYIIKYHRDLCIGTTACVAAAPENYSLDNERKAVVKTLEITEKELKKIFWQPIHVLFML